MHQINIALQQYEAVNGKYPPAYSFDKDGKPLLSWRVLILPYLNQDNLYRRFHLDEPWDSPHNRIVANEMPAIFRCPSETDQQSKNTSYVLISGQGTAFEGGDSLKAGKVRSPGETIFVAEAADSGILWTEPRDVDIAALQFGLNAPAGQGLRSGHPSGVVVGYADGHIMTLPKNTSPAELRRQVTVKP